jgi:AbiU2
MESLFGSSIDEKNIGLAKTLFSLRHDLDVYCLIGVNATQIKQSGQGKFFFGHVQMRVLDSIILAICKIYEEEKGFELNSIQGVLNSLEKRNATASISEQVLRDFVRQYEGPSDEKDWLKALRKTVGLFKIKYAADLKRFKTARDKVIAHSEYQAMINDVPSFDTMEKLFEFGAEFYSVVSHSFIGSGPDDLKNRREVKRDFRKVLKVIGVQDIKTEME